MPNKCERTPDSILRLHDALTAALITPAGISASGSPGSVTVTSGPLVPLQSQPQPQPQQAPADSQARAKDALVVSGTGKFVKTSPPLPATSSGPEEFSLNFEATDIRAIVQSIMGDYLRESFTIHPQTTGTGTIRLSKAVSRADLIPILEMMLRQNGQIMVREEGLYKIMPAWGVTEPRVPMAAGMIL